MPTELFVSRLGGRTWTVLRENGSCVEIRVERHDQPARLGRIVKARVTTVIPAIQSAFVDAGLERDAFLHASDLMLRDLEGCPIESRLDPGRELLVQISRESVSAKGDRATCNLGIPGRLLVLFPRGDVSGVSRRIGGVDERARLAREIESLSDPDSGFLARTAARGATAEALGTEASRLRETWKEIRAKARTRKAPSVLHQDLRLPLRVLRDAPAEGFDRIWMDHEEERDGATAYLRDVDPLLASRIRLHAGRRPLFEVYGLEKDVERALRPRVWLPCGGQIVIEETEALVSIDVNTSKATRGRSQKKTILETNLQAAREIARQLRLRDLGGIIAVDFVDMESPDDRGCVIEAMRSALADDSARTKIVGLSEIGLLELTRERSRAGLSAAVTHPCPHCSGSGRVRRPETVFEPGPR